MDYQNWINETRKILENNYGLSPWMSERCAWLFLYLDYYRIPYTLTSAYRDPVKQAQMRAAWDAGNRAGLKARPAADSLHTRQSWLGSPAAEAIDITSSQQSKVDEIAKFLGLGLGKNFSSPDPVHYYNPTAK